MTDHRTTARVLPVSPDGAVLLLEEQDPARPGERYWSSIGGAIDPGESPREAAARELREETGIVVDAERLVGPLHRHQNTYSWGGVDYRGDHAYFSVALASDVVVTFDQHQPEEIGNILGSRWWRPDELTGVACRPPELPEIMAVVNAAAPGGSR